MIGLVNANAFRIPLADNTVQCVVTSPPYWGLRDYGYSDQIGLEPTPAAYVANIVAVMRECWRVLKDDGTLWLNLGDSYTSGGRDSRDPGQSKLHPAQQKGMRRADTPDGLKPKDLVGIPWRVAFALQEDGWYLRSDIIWAKPNPMPESVTDRPTKAHEYVFLMTKRSKYYYDNEAIKETGSIESVKRLERGVSDNHKNVNGAPGQTPHSMNQPRKNIHSITEAEAYIYDMQKEKGYEPSTRNARTVWTIATRPYSGAHFATMPPALAEKCILAGSRVGDIILDPFTGSGTTARVAVQHRRRFIGTELSAEYIGLTADRVTVQTEF